LETSKIWRTRRSAEEAGEKDGFQQEISTWCYLGKLRATKPKAHIRPLEAFWKSTDRKRSKSRSEGLLEALGRDPHVPSKLSDTPGKGVEARPGDLPRRQGLKK